MYLLLLESRDQLDKNQVVLEEHYIQLTLSVFYGSTGRMMLLY
jgi:hypothetical protein